MYKYIAIIKVRIFMYLTIYLLFTLGVQSALCQDLLWKNNFTGTGNNTPNKSVIDSENNIYILSTFNGTCNVPSPILTTQGNADIAISKYDVNGNHLWSQQIGGGGAELATGIAISPDDEYIYITGYFQQTVFGVSCIGGMDGFLAKYKKNGDRLWFKNIAKGSTNQRPNGIQIDKNNNLVIAGWYFDDITLGSSNNITLSTTQPIGLFVAKFDTSGLAINAKKIETTNSATKLYALNVDTSGYYLTGYFNGDLITDIGTKSSINNSLDFFIYKTDFNLSGKFIITGGGSSNEFLTSCSTGDDGYIYLGGYFSSSVMTVDSIAQTSIKASIPSLRTPANKTSDGKTDIFFAKYKHDGTLQWFNTAGSTENDYLYRALYNNGNFIAAGQYGAPLTFNNKTITPKNNADAFAIVQNQYDNLVYLIPFGGTSGAEVGETAVVDNNGNFIVIGDYTSSKLYINNKDSLINSNAGTRDMFIAKFDKAGLDSVLIQPTCPGAATGAIYITPTGTVVDPITFAWSKDGDPSFSATTQNITGLTAGTYRVTFTDKLGYAKSKSFILNDPTPISITINSTTNVSCFGGNNGIVDINVAGGTAPYTYAWTTNGGSGINAIVQDQVTLTAGSYNVQVTDKNGCMATLNNIELTQPEKITFKDTKVIKINGGAGSVDLFVQGGTTPYTYLWSGAGPVTNPENEDIGGISIAGNYTVVVTDAKLCKMDTTVFIADSHVLNAYLGSKQNVLCKGGNTGNITILTENVTGTPEYTWAPNVGNTATVTNLSAGNYAVTVTDGSTISAIVNVTIAEPASDLTISVAKANITCSNANNGVLDANAAGGSLPYTYNWTKEAQPFDGGNETLINLSEGSYAVTVTDANNCTASSIQSITNPSLITFNGTVNGVTCEGTKNDGSITLSNIQGGAGSYTYLWSNGMSTQNTTLLSANNYTVTVTDANNCKVFNNFVVGYAAPMTISFNTTPVTCNGAGNGALEAVVTGGHTGFSYEWSTGALTKSISGLLPNVPYSVTVTDGKFCVKTASGTLAEPAVLSIASANQTNISCYGASSGSVALTVSGGTAEYSYNWDQGVGTASSATNLPAGTFNVTVTDARNCTTTGAYTITQPTALTLSEDINARVNPLCNGLSTGSITLLASGGSGEYELSMNSGNWAVNTVYSNLAAGNYNFKLRDKNAITCEYTLAETISITQPEAISLVSVSSTDVTQKAPWNGSITLVSTGGSTPLTYTLNPGAIQQTNGIFTDLAPDNYTITITDANNCAPVTTSPLTISDLTSISMINGEVLKIFPIPANDYLNITYEGAYTTKPLAITLFSMNGKIMYKENVSAETMKSGTYRINVQSMPKGTYILKINDSVSNEKIIIQ